VRRSAYLHVSSLLFFAFFLPLLTHHRANTAQVASKLYQLISETSKYSSCCGEKVSPEHRSQQKYLRHSAWSILSVQACIYGVATTPGIRLQLCVGFSAPFSPGRPLSSASCCVDFSREPALCASLGLLRQGVGLWTGVPPSLQGNGFGSFRRCAASCAPTRATMSAHSYALGCAVQLAASRLLVSASA